MHPYSVPVQKKVPLAPALSRMSTSVDVYWYGPSSYASASIPGDVHLEMTMPGFGARLISSSGLGVGMARPGAAARRTATRPVVVSILAVSSESWRKGCWRTKPGMGRRRGLYHGGISTAVPEPGRPFFGIHLEKVVGGPPRTKGWYVQTARYQRGRGELEYGQSGQASDSVRQAYVRGAALACRCRLPAPFLPVVGRPGDKSVK